MAHDITYFFSYAREDSETVLKLAKELRSVGATLWIDQLDILGGQRWDRAVEEALQSCQGMLAVLSPESVQSTNVMDEVSYALEEGKLVVPILLRPCTIPFRLRRVQYIDFTGNYGAGFDQLLRALSVDSAPQALPELSADGGEPAVPDANAQTAPDDRISEAFNTSSGSPSAALPVTRPAIRPSDDWPATAWLSTVLLWIADVVYSLFTWALLNSTQDDQPSGYMFLVNAVILTAGCIAASLKLLRPEHIAIAAAVLQIGIMVLMLLQGLGDALISVPVNTGIALAFVACGFAHRIRRIKPPVTT
jgi:hypothetical protein